MERRTLGRTGLKVSALGFGGGPIGHLEADKREVGRILNTLLDRGVNLVDTAQSYLGSEEMIGESIGHRRDEYVLVTKCGKAIEGVEGKAWSAAVIERTVDRALRRLRTDHLDVMLLHSCDLHTLQAGEAIEALQRARDVGKIRFAGYSGDNDAAVYAAQSEVIDVVETSINICDQANIDVVLPLTRRRNVGVIAKRPIANAAWNGSSHQKGLYIDYTKPYVERFAKMAPTLEKLGFQETAETWPEIALRFTMWQDGVASAIVGTTKESHVERNLHFVSKGPLPDSVVNKLREAFQHTQSTAGEKWAAQN